MGFKESLFFLSIHTVGSEFLRSQGREDLLPALSRFLTAKEARTDVAPADKEALVAFFREQARGAGQKVNAKASIYGAKALAQLQEWLTS